MVVRLAKLTLGLAIGLAAGYILSVTRPRAASDQPMEDFP